MPHQAGHYAVLVPPFTGHLNPLFALAGELQRRGHRLTFLSLGDAEPRVRAAGFEFIPLATPEFPPGEWERRLAVNAQLTGLKASSYICAALALFARGIFRDLPEIQARAKFDGLIMDQVSVGTESVCDAIGLPMVLACCALIFHTETRVPPLMFPWAFRDSAWCRLRNVFAQLLVYATGFQIIRQLAPYRFKNSLRPMGFKEANEVPPSLVQVSQLPRFFDFPRRRLPNHFHYTGPWLVEDGKQLPEFPWEKLDGRPLIYASMGTLQNRLDHVFESIAEACAGERAQLVIALGNKNTTPPSLPGNPLIVAYAPQRALLKRASLVITHGGLNTTLEALTEGVPLIVLPVTNDQPGVAARVKYLGAGELIPLSRLTVPRLRQALADLNTNPAYRKRATELSNALRNLRGAAQAADLVETAFQSGQRILRDCDE